MGKSQPQGKAMEAGIAPCRPAQSKNNPAAKACSSSLPLGVRPVLWRLVRLRQSSTPPITMKARVTRPMGSSLGSLGLTRLPTTTPQGTSSKPPMVGVPDLLWWDWGPSWRITCPIFKARKRGIPSQQTSQLRPPASSRGTVS